MSEYIQSMLASYNGIAPTVNGTPAQLGEGATVVGRVTIGGGACLGSWSVIRADGHYVEIGNDFYLGEHATVHIAHELYPTRIGDRVTAGKNSVIHACDVKANCVIERDAIVLDGSCVGKGAVISSGSVVFPRSELEGGWVYSGSPVKPVARVSASELASLHQMTRNEISTPERKSKQVQNRLDCFVAPSARLRGVMSAGKEVGIWYGCRLDAGRHRIVVGEGTNIQDNSTIICGARDVSIGSHVTIGHNVSITDSDIEAGSLVGIGATIAAGTIVESDVLVAAGAQTEPGQWLTSGNIWAGRPARVIGQMDSRKREMLARTLPQYRDYAAKFRRTSHEPFSRQTKD